MRQKLRFLILPAVIVGILIAFSSTEEEPVASPVSPSTQRPAASPVSLCVKISNALGKTLVESQSDFDGMKFVQGQAVKSPNHVKVYFIATEFSAPGIDNQVAVFMSDTLDGRGAVKALNGVAKEFTQWFDAGLEDEVDPTVAEVRGCLS